MAGSSHPCVCPLSDPCSSAGDNRKSESTERCYDALRQAMPLLLPMLKAQEGWEAGWEVRTPQSAPPAPILAKLGLTQPPDDAWRHFAFTRPELIGWNSSSSSSSRRSRRHGAWPPSDSSRLLARRRQLSTT
mmetsp:Transcript_36989/g.73869  ORF Transcript_36989/g.73869 Transcript_36989/m.73869 type:complete len:132 (+) Transcript_36989:824-1219(+)